ncbi:MAG TPA: carboxypeptidase M32 [Gemmataceae bacterium]|nr:carboxypeptidase M32 [Gemmataceae bacterium]
MTPQAAYDELLRRAREATLLGSCLELLGWDELTYMPRGGVRNRGEQTALLAGLYHERATDPRLGELLDILECSDLLADRDAATAVNVCELRRTYDRETRLPRALVEEQARVTSTAQQEWEAAREDADYARFCPWLERVLALKREEAAALGGGGDAYDALLEEYEPGATGARLAVLFEALRRELVPLAAAIAGGPRRSELTLLHREYPVERQRFFAQTVAAALGFDFHRGRLDATAHPFFSSIGPGDYRIATRYSPRNFGDAFFGMLHEVGHALYEQGLDPAHHGTPMGEAVSLGVHESQARLWENTVGRSLPFWRHFFPLARSVFHEALHDVTLDAFHAAINHVGPSLIRVSADEVTYNLHILIRFELERALLTGDLPAPDLPGAWNDAYRRHLGVTPGDDAEGCLQDGHWGAGLVGYFPTYTLGNIFAAQLFARAAAELGDLDGALARGEFDGLLGWLRDKVHRHGSRYSAARLIEKATGAPPDHRPLVQALRRKYGELYGL